ncbi:MAG: choline-binding transcriptional repressor BetI [Paracoccaceae bacterium]
MPKVGQEPARRAALVSATIQEIGRAGSLDVTVGQIAKSAGMSTALAHYYFDSKGALFLAAMRHILGEFGTSVRRRLRQAVTPVDRLDSIIEASLGPDQFKEHVVAAWLVFYVEAQRSPAAARLLNIYARRLHSNLVHELRQLVSPVDARKIAQGAAAMIDGIYIRSALYSETAHPGDARALVRDYLKLTVAACAPPTGKLN